MQTLDNAKNIVNVGIPQKTTSKPPYKYVITYFDNATSTKRRKYCKTLREANETRLQIIREQKAHVTINTSLPSDDTFAYRGLQQLAIVSGKSVIELITEYTSAVAKLNKVRPDLPIEHVLLHYQQWILENNTNITLDKAVKQYLKYVREHRQRSYSAVNYNLELLLTHFGKDTRLVDLNAKNLTEWITNITYRRRYKGKNIGDTVTLYTQYAILSYVRAFLTYCRKYGFISINVASQVILPRHIPAAPQCYSVKEVPQQVVHIAVHSS